MKQFLLFALLAGTMQMVSAQDLKKVQTNVILKKLDEAKVEVDKAMADPKQKPYTGKPGCMQQLQPTHNYARNTPIR